MIATEKAAQNWDGYLVLDAGDAFVPMSFVRQAEQGQAIATAEFIVDRFNDEGLTAMTFGDRDLALGRDVLTSLKSRARFPILASNLVDKETGGALFDSHAMVEVAGVKVGIIGALSPSIAERTLKGNGRMGPDTIKVSDPLAATKSSYAALEAAGAELFVLLGHLTHKDAEEIATALPKLRLSLGGHSMVHRTQTLGYANAYELACTQKGKHLTVSTMNIWDELGPLGRLENRNKYASLDETVAQIQRRIDSFNKRIETLKGDKKAKKKSLRTLERNLVASKSELRLKALEREDLGEVIYGANFIETKLVPLGPKIKGDPALEAMVAEFRKVYPSAETKKKAEAAKRKAAKAKKKKKKKSTKKK